MSILDNIIFGADYTNKTLLATVDARELHILRSIGVQWQTVQAMIQAGFNTAMAVPDGEGPVYVCLQVSRATARRDLNGQPLVHVQAFMIPGEMLTWPS